MFEIDLTKIDSKKSGLFLDHFFVKYPKDRYLILDDILHFYL